MRHHPHMPAEEWARRINRSWIVHNNLNDQAEAWVDYLETGGDPRLKISCEAARAMCDLRDPLDDPKPWFYAGLFHLATPEEAFRFLDLHRVTKATVTSMRNDENVRLWINRISLETKDLLERLRYSLTKLEADRAR